MQNPTITVKPINIYSDIAVALFHQCAFTIIFQEFVGPQTPSLFEEHTLNVYFPQGKLENVTLLFYQVVSIQFSWYPSRQYLYLLFTGDWWLKLTNSIVSGLCHLYSIV